MPAWVGGHKWNIEVRRFDHEEGISPDISGIADALVAARKYSVGVASWKRQGASALFRIGMFSITLSLGANKSVPQPR